MVVTTGDYLQGKKQNKTKGSSIVEVSKPVASETTSSFGNGVRNVLGPCIFLLCLKS